MTNHYYALDVSTGDMVFLLSRTVLDAIRTLYTADFYYDANNKFQYTFYKSSGDRSRRYLPKNQNASYFELLIIEVTNG